LILTVDTGRKQDLTDVQMRTLSTKLRTRIPQLINWSYSPLTGFLTLEFGDTEDNNLFSRIEDWRVKADSIKLVRFELLEMVRRWLE